MQVESKNIFNFEQVKPVEPLASYIGGKTEWEASAQYEISVKDKVVIIKKVGE